MLREKSNLKEIVSKVKSACENISDTDKSVWHTNEWNICGHIQQRLAKEFPNYNVDIEPVKIDRKRPDIVVHKRGNNLGNLVVFQVKRRPGTDDIKEDLNKIMKTFFEEPYSYKFGVFISIGKLPPLPEFNPEIIGIVEIDGYKLANSDEKVLIE